MAAAVTATIFGIDFIDNLSPSAAQCLKGQGNYMVTRIFQDANGGQCDPVGGPNIEVGLAAGLEVGGYIFPNPVSMGNGVHTPTQQVDMGAWCGTAAGLQKNMYTLDIKWIRTTLGPLARPAAITSSR